MTTLLILNILTIASILFLVIKLFFCRSKLIILQQRNVDFQSTIDGIEKQLVDCNNENNNLKEKNNALINDINIKDYEIRQLHAKIDEIKNNSNEAQKQMLTQFQNLANNILEEKTKKFTEQNQTNLDNILKPLAEKIQMFEKQIETSNKNNNDQTTSLRLEIGKLYALNNRMTKEAENLTNAIKGDTKIQGNWGEYILEKILEISGLEKGREYLIQESVVTDEGKRLQPDVIINLPSQKRIVIDSKVSLVNYEQYFNSNNNDERNDQLKKHLTSIKRHIIMLSDKDYQSKIYANSLDFVLMFIPIEQAFTLIIQNDQNIITEAYNRNIIIVSPSSLFATLRTVSNVWRNEYQNKNAMLIAQQSGALYDKFVGFIEDLKQIGKQIDNAKTSYIESTKKLYDGKGNIISRIENIKSLGAKSSKSLDENILNKLYE